MTNDKECKYCTELAEDDSIFCLNHRHEDKRKQIQESMNNEHIKSAIKLLEDRSNVKVVDLFSRLYEYMDQRQDVDEDRGNEENGLIGPISSLLFSIKKAQGHTKINPYDPTKCCEGKCQVH